MTKIQKNMTDHKIYILKLLANTTRKYNLVFATDVSLADSYTI